MRTTDAALSTFYAAAARDCACGCDGHGVKVDGVKVYDAALNALRDAGFDESKHKRSGNGQFGAGTTVSKSTNNEETHEVHHEGRHLGTVREAMTYQRNTAGKSTASKPMVKRWSTFPARIDEKMPPRSEFDFRSKKDAVHALKRAHGIT